MAQLKDLLVNGASRLIGDAFVNKIQITTINAPTSSGGTTYGPGTSGQVLKSNGTSVYWGTDSNGSLTINLTQSGESYSIDKTYDEIKTALESGMNCVVLYNANNHIYYYPFNHQDYNFSTQEFIYYFANSYVYNSTTAANEGCKIYKQNNTTVVQSYHSAFSKTVVNSPQAPTETFVLYYDDEESKWVLNQSQSEIGDMSDAMEYDIIISLKKELTHSDSYYEENSEWYYLTRKYVTEVYSEEYGENIYTGHLVFQSVIEDNGVKKIKTITISDYFDQYDYLGNATITFSEEVVNITHCCDATLSSAGWYRVFLYSSTNDDELAGSKSANIRITITREGIVGNSFRNEVHFIDFSLAYGSYIFSNETSVTQSLAIDKIRYGYDLTNHFGFIDIHCKRNDSNPITVSFNVATDLETQGEMASVEPYSVADAPSGETVLATHDFVANTHISGSVVGSYGTIYYDRKGGVCSIYGDVTGIPTGAWTTLATGLPAPARTQFFIAQNGASTDFVMCHLNTSGELKFYGRGSYSSGYPTWTYACN